MQTLVTDSKIIVSPPGFASHSLTHHCPEYTSIGRGRRRSSLFFILFESEFGGDVSSADTIPTADSMR